MVVASHGPRRSAQYPHLRANQYSQSIPYTFAEGKRAKKLNNIMMVGTKSD